MGNSKDYYEILGVKKNASDSELKSAYRRLAVRWHPDKQSGKTDAEKKEAEEKFKSISEAYSVLSDKEKRARYDQFGPDGMRGGGFDFGGIDPMEMFRKMHRDFGFGFGFNADDELNDKRHKPSAEDLNRPEDGSDIAMQIKITFKEGIFGCSKEFDLNLDKECPECHGSGIERGTEPVECPECHGSGYIAQTIRRGWMISQTVSPCQKCRGSGFSIKYCKKCEGMKRISEVKHAKVKIPAGFQDGMRLRLNNLGQSGVKGGSNGSLYLTVRIEPSDLFDRNGNDIYIKAFVSPVIASLGGKIEVPTVYGYKNIKIDPGTESGTKLKVSGGGVKPENGTAGDMIIELEVSPYSSVTAEQRELLEKLRKLESKDCIAKSVELRNKAESFYN